MFRIRSSRLATKSYSFTKGHQAPESRLDSNEDLTRLAANLMTSPEGPLKDKGVRTHAVEAMLIRYRPKMNEKPNGFPLTNRPGLVKPLLAEGITGCADQLRSPVLRLAGRCESPAANNWPRGQGASGAIQASISSAE